MELLAVLVLISALALITVPSIINYINKSKDDISEVTKKLIYSGTELYIDNNQNKFAKIGGNQYCVTLEELVDENYLSEPILDSMSGEEISLNKFVQITYLYDNSLNYSKFNFDIVDSCENKKIICSASKKITNYREEYIEDNIDPITRNPIGVLATKESPYNYGTEYQCDVGDGIQRTFYVLEDGDAIEDGIVEEGHVALIMDQNVNSDKFYSSEVDSKLRENISHFTNDQIINVTIPTYNQIYRVLDSNWLNYNLYSALCQDFF